MRTKEKDLPAVQRLLPLLASLLLVATNVALAQEAAPEGRRGPVLTVKGEGRTELKPDYALFGVTVRTTAPTAEGAARRHNDRAAKGAAALEALRNDGLSIDRSSFALRETRPAPIYGNPGNPPQRPSAPPPSATAETSFSLRIKPIERLNETISKLAASGVLEVQSVTFRVEQERAALNQARRAAMSDAREQAEAYAEAGDLRLTEIIAVTDGEASPISDGAADLPRGSLFNVRIVPPATVAFVASVNVTWRIAAK